MGRNNPTKINNLIYKKMEFIGQVKDVGTARKINDKWFRDIVLSQLNYNNGYEHNIVFTVIDEKINFNGNKDYSLKKLHDDKLLTPGQILKVLFNINARQTQDGRWFNSVTAWGMNTLDYSKTNSAGNATSSDNEEEPPF